MIVKENENIIVYLVKIKIDDTTHTTNMYVLKDKITNKVLVIDPAFDGKKIRDVLKEIGGDLECVIITHSHADHIAGLAELVNGTNVKVYVHESDKSGLYDPVLNEEKIVATKVATVAEKNVIVITDGQKVVIGNTNLTVMHTPGHTSGSIITFNEQENIMFSGDTIFEKTYGRTDLVASKPESMKETIDKIFNRFDNILVFPGHGEIFNLENSKRKIRLLFAFKERG